MKTTAIIAAVVWLVVSIVALVVECRNGDIFEYDCDEHWHI